MKNSQFYFPSPWVNTCIRYREIGATLAYAIRSLGPHLLLQHKNWIHMHLHPQHRDWVHTCIRYTEIGSTLAPPTQRLVLHLHPLH